MFSNSAYRRSLHSRTGRTNRPRVPRWAHLFQKLEAAAYETLKPTSWERYVDDTFTIIPGGRQTDFKAHVNSIFTDIQFTMEEEKYGVLPFLDILVRQRDNGELTTSVFRKTTNTLQMLSFNSNRPQTYKRSCVKTLSKRVETRCSTPEAKEEELRYLKRQFSLNGYPSSFIQKTLRKRPAGSTIARPSMWQAIPTIANISEAVARLLKPYGIGVAHRPAGT